MDALDLEPQRSAVFYWFRGMGFGYEECEDLTQEAFLRALLSDTPVRDTPSWLRRIAHNLAISRFRALDRRPPPIELELLYEWPDESPDPCELAIRSDIGRLVRQAVDELPAHWRSVVVGMHYRRLPIMELADVLGVEVGTIKSRHARARARLKRRLSPIFSG